MFPIQKKPTLKSILIIYNNFIHNNQKQNNSNVHQLLHRQIKCDFNLYDEILVRKNTLQIHMTWMAFQCIMLSEKSQTLYNVWFHLYDTLENTKLEGQISGCQGWEKGVGREVWLQGAWCYIWGWWKCSISRLWQWLQDYAFAKIHKILMTILQKGWLFLYIGYTSIIWLK